MRSHRVAGAVPLFLVDRFLGNGTVRDVVGGVVVAGASAAAFAYLWRQRRP
jgi:hypothetical protein